MRVLVTGIRCLRHGNPEKPRPVIGCLLGLQLRSVGRWWCNGVCRTGVG